MSRTIGSCVTPSPLTIGANQTLERAHQLMRGHRVRHLPVLRNGELVGLVSQRDLLLVETLKDVDPAKVPVEDAMAVEPFTAQRGEPLAKVVRQMADKRYGSVIVLDGREIVGIFTAVDALEVLHDLLVQQKAARAKRPALRARAAARSKPPRKRQLTP